MGCSADIGSWIKDDIVDVWFPPGPAAGNWGIQRLTLTVEQTGRAEPIGASLRLRMEGRGRHGRLGDDDDEVR